MCLMYRLVMPGHHVNIAFKTVNSHTTLTNRRIVPMFYFKDEKTGLHICDYEFVIGQVVFICPSSTGRIMVWRGLSVRVSVRSHD
jgi:hypothetical protein